MRPGLLGAEADGKSHTSEDDLGLSAVIDAMGDGFIADTARTVLLSTPPPPEIVAYRQEVLSDCLREPDLVLRLHELASQAVEIQRNAARAVFFDTPETLLKQSTAMLTSFLGLLRELRTLRPAVSSTGFKQFFALVEEHLGDDFLKAAGDQLDQLRLGGTILVSARLGAGNQSEALVMRRPLPRARGLFRRGPSVPTATYKVPYGDEAGHRALSSLQDQALAGLADAAHRSAQHVLAFFTALRFETAFYLGSLNLHRALTERGAPVCLPTVNDASARVLNARGLYDPGLQLRLDQPVVPADLDADGMSLIMVTGANRGGKSTFLRGLGLAQLMAGAGTFVAATAFTTSARSGVHTHFTQDEDDTRTSGKFDEELRRMSELADALAPHGLLLCNESFQSTNEREGSDIARRVIEALTAAGVTVVFVTHLHELAHHCYDNRTSFPALFLRADPSFRLQEAPPEATHQAADLWSPHSSGLLRRTSSST